MRFGSLRDTVATKKKWTAPNLPVVRKYKEQSEMRKTGQYMRELGQILDHHEGHHSGYYPVSNRHDHVNQDDMRDKIC